MDEKLIAGTSLIINASPSRVWEALIDPDLIKQYLFGTEVTTDWQVGSPITYRGVWNGKAYEDKGRVLKNEEGRLLVSSFWSSLAGLADVPENYKTVTYELEPAGDATILTITQDNNATAEEADTFRREQAIGVGRDQTTVGRLIEKACFPQEVGIGSRDRIPKRSFCWVKQNTLRDPIRQNLLNIGSN